MSWFFAITVAAVLGTPHCIAMCGPLAVAGCGEHRVLPYHLGRMVTYSILGALAGGFSELPMPTGVATGVSAVLLVGFTLSLLGWLPTVHVNIPGVRKAASFFLSREGMLPRFGFGLVNGLLPCGLLYATLAVPVASGSALVGAMLMAWFAALTAIPLSVSSFGLQRLMKRKAVRTVLAVVVLITGIATLADRGAWFSEEPAPMDCH